MLTVEGLAQLSTTKNFTLVAGALGVHRPVRRVEILDFEFSHGVPQVREKAFNGESIVLSSLLFAEGQPEMLIDTIKRLITLNVSALAYKPVIFKALPEEVLNFANEQSFPILCFGGDEFFEDIIMEVSSFLKDKNDQAYLEMMMRCFIEERLSDDQKQTYIKQSGAKLDKNILVANIELDTNKEVRHNDFLQLEAVINGIVCTYKQSIFIVLSNQSANHTFVQQLQDWLTFYNLRHDTFTIGFSQVHEQSALDVAVREAYFTRIMASIEQLPSCQYKELTTARMIMELYYQNKQFSHQYTTSYLTPILDEPELLQTLIRFILAKGNMKEVAQTQFCHPNTIRYRISKVRQLLDENSNDFEFYEHASMAVKLYLLQRKIEDPTFIL